MIEFENEKKIKILWINDEKKYEKNMNKYLKLNMK